MPRRRGRPTAQIEARLIRPKLTKRVAERVDAYFRDFGRRLVPALEGPLGRLVEPTKAEGGVDVALRTFGWDGEARRFLSYVQPAIEIVGDAATRAVGSELGLDVSFDLFARRPVLTDVATRIQSIPDTSREAVRRLVDEGIARGDSIEQLSRSMRSLVDSWLSTGTRGFAGLGAGRRSRSYLIALTETANAWNVAATESYRAAGVAFVEVFDGPDCGWSSHDDPDLAHGSVRSVEDARKTPTSHPRCQRAFGARVDAEGASASPFGREGAVPGATPGIGAIDPLDASALHLSGAGAAIPSRAVAEASQRAWEAARIAERDISASLLRVAGDRIVSFDQAMAGLEASPGGDLAGFAARRKTLTSLSRKIATDQEVAALGSPPRIAPADVFAREIGDSVRYTVRFQEGEYWDGVKRSAQELVDGGNTPIKWKPTWDSPIYRGLNTTWRAPNGTLFEVQFHTPTSFVTKELNHSAYDVARLLTTSAEDRALLELEMATRTAAVPVPSGAWLTFEDALGLRSSSTLLDLEGRIAAETSGIRTLATHEEARVFDEAGNLFFSKVGTGETASHAGSVPHTTEELLSFAGKIYVHNHPGAYQAAAGEAELTWATSFSSGDVVLAVRYSFAEIRAIGKGADYVLRPLDGARAADAEIFGDNLEETIAAMNQAVRTEFEARVAEVRRVGGYRDYQEAVAEASRDHWHEVWRRLAFEHPDWWTYERRLLE